MKIMEYEGRQLLFESKISVPFGRIIETANEIEETLSEFKFPVMIKAQILSGGRGKAGAVKIAQNKEEARKMVNKMLGSEILGERVKKVLVVNKLNVEKEIYVCFTFSTDTRTPILILCKDGGINIEEQANVKITPIDALSGVNEESAREYLEKAGTEKELALFIVKLYKVFKKNDMILTEINPLIKTKEGKYYAADMKGVLDDEGLIRHKFPFPKRTGFRELTEREEKARKIDEEDYSGVAGKTFIEFDGDIAVLASGGGASITAVDAIYSYGARPANYTEYSGNPSGEKVRKLTEITLDKPNLAGCFVVGGKANFTRIDLTLGGFLEALRKVKPKYPIVIRRDGPKRDEAFDMLRKAAKEEGYDIHLYDFSTPITKAAQIMAELSRKYKETK